MSENIHPWNQSIWHSLSADSERQNHALLFCGSAGLAKQSLAIELARHVLTTDQKQGETLFNAGTHPDFHVIMPENNQTDDVASIAAQRYFEVHRGKPKKGITIEQVRRLSAALTTHPHISNSRVILVFYAEMMNQNSANALLKSLEEPPANTLFILVSDEPARLASTIRSRCSLITFHEPEFAIGKSWLQQQNIIPEQDIDSYLAIANQAPLKAIELYKQEYMGLLKSVFTSVNDLWGNKYNPLQVAKMWHDNGSVNSLDLLQKLVVDLLRFSVSQTPVAVFFPIQKSWLSKVCTKFSTADLFALNDKINKAKQQLKSNADELLILETVSQQFYKLAN